MKTKNSLWIIISIIIALFTVSCSDDDDTIKFYENIYGAYGDIKVMNITVGSHSVKVKGGSGEYTAISGDESIVTITSVKNYSGGECVISFNAEKTGVTYITVKDEKNNSATLAVTVTSQTLSMVVTGYTVNIEGTDEVTKKEIEDILMKSFPVEKEGKYELIYKTIAEGELIVHKNKDDITGTKGTFIYDLKQPMESNILTMKHNGKTYEYTLQFSLTSKMSVAPPVEAYLMEDLTEEYRNLYPNAGIKKVERAQQVLYNFW